ncbi:MAG: NUDIX hydrolase [Planctomycetota bacterium]|nr:MAG: NUDIX hydrolase [Planctomycetota bacterium]
MDEGAGMFGHGHYGREENMEAMSDPLPPFHRHPIAPPDDAPWRITAASCVYENPWTRVIEEHLDSAQGEKGLYAYFAPVDCAVVVPVLGKGAGAHVHLVRQWRQAYRQYTWELPCGRLDAGETPLQAGQRELAEECGLHGGSWEVLGQWLHSDARVAGTSHCFVVRNPQTLARPPEKDRSEKDLQSHAVGLDQLWRMLDDGSICQVTTVAALLRLRLYMLDEVT